MKKVTVLVLFIVACHFSGQLFAQSTAVASTALNVLYQGLNNRLAIQRDGVKRSQLVVTCRDFVLLDSGNYYYINVPKGASVKETWIVVGVKKKKGVCCLDSVLFRVKRMPFPVAQLGNLSGGGSFQRGQYLSQRLVYAYMEGFIYENVKYVITEYDFEGYSEEDLGVYRCHVNGNSTKEIQSFIATHRRFSKFNLVNIRAVMQSPKTNNDTLHLNPISFYLWEAPNEKYLIGVQFKKGTRYTESLDTMMKWNKGNGVSLLYTLYRNDTQLLAQRKDSVGVMQSFQRYYKMFPGQLELAIESKNDTIYHLRYYNDRGLCIAEGDARNFYFNVNYKDDLYGIRFSNFADSVMYFLKQQALCPVGEWTFYLTDQYEIVKGSFIQKPNAFKGKDDSIAFYCTDSDEAFCSRPVGTWIRYKAADPKNIIETVSFE